MNKQRWFQQHRARLVANDGTEDHQPNDGSFNVLDSKLLASQKVDPAWESTMGDLSVLYY